MESLYTRSVCVISAVLVLFVGACTETDLPENLNPAAEQMKSAYQEMVTEYIKYNIQVAQELAENSELASLVQAEQCPLVEKLLNSVAKEIMDTTEHKNIKLHMHTLDGYSAARSWERIQKKDNLGFYRHSIHYARKSGEVVSGFEMGGLGLVLRSVIPFYSGKDILGTVESIQSIDPIVEKLASKGITLLFMVNKNKLELAPNSKNAPVAQELAVMQSSYDVDLFQAMKDIDLHELYTEPYIVYKGFLIAAVEVFDVSNIISGVALLAKRI